MSPKRKKSDSKNKEELEKKIDGLKALLLEEKEKSESYLKQLKYARADLENLKKQMQKRIDETVARGNQRLIINLLPIFEELELAVKAAKDKADSGILEGVEMVKNKMRKILESEGVSYIDAIGKSFDPHLHEAVLEVETQDYPDGTVVEEYRKGYIHRDRVLRASMVKVARKPSSNEVQEEEDSE